jgi:hypothetical protein
MSELTDSYCERCGTRYTFGPSPSRGPSLTGARLLAKGLRNFVMTDGTSIDEAMAAARIDVTKDESTRVTEEFHRTFNFCMTCRQYACDKCWNENQGACLSCAPLWDEGPVAPQSHLIVRTPVSRLDPEDARTVTRSPSLGAGPAGPAGPAGLSGEVAWPEADPLPGRPALRPGGNGKRPLEAAPTAQAPQVEPWPPAPAFAPPVPPKVEPTARTQPLERVLPPDLPQQPRQPARLSDEERIAAQQLHAQAQAWKSRDDDWALWPLNEGSANPEMALTPEELRVINTQLEQPAASRRQDVAPAPVAGPPVEPFTPSHTLAEDAARVTEPEPDYRTEPAQPAQVAWEPETPARSQGPSSDFDLLGSLRQPIELAPRTEPARPDAAPDQQRKPGIGRLLGRHARVEETPSVVAPPTPKPVKSPRPGSTEPAMPWPTPTKWIERPIEHHDWWGDESAAGEQAAPSVAAEADAEIIVAETPAPTFAAPHQPEEVSAFAPEPEAEQPPAQQPQSAAPSASPSGRAPATPDQFDRASVAWPASDPLDRRPATPPTPPPPAKRRRVEPAPAAAPQPEEPAPWPPIGASWPAQTSPAAPWPMPGADVPASVVAASRAEQTEAPESPLVTALWAESTQQVLDRGSVRVCHHCALPVSTQARFCRRCGTRQG